jgi:hypothetical protein
MMESGNQDIHFKPSIKSMLEIMTYDNHSQQSGKIIIEPGTEKNHSQPTMMESATSKRENMVD